MREPIYLFKLLIFLAPILIKKWKQYLTFYPVASKEDTSKTNKKIDVRPDFCDEENIKDENIKKINTKKVPIKSNDNEKHLLIQCKELMHHGNQVELKAE